MKGQLTAGAVLLVAALGCGNKTQECQADVADLADYLRKLRYEGFSVLTSAKLVTRTDVPDSPQAAPSVDLLPTGSQMNGKMVDASTLAEQLIAQSMALSRSGANAHNTQTAPAVLFAVDEATPWGTVVEMAQAAATGGFRHIGFLFAVPDNVPPPPRTSVDDEMAKLPPGSPGGKAAALATLLRDISARCKPMNEVFANLATYNTGDKSEIYASGVSKAILECNCNIDIPKFRSVSYHIFSGQNPRALKVTVSSEGSPLAFPATMPWRDVSKQLKPNTVAALAVK